MQTPLKSASEHNYAPTQPLLTLGRDNPQPSNFLWEALRERFRYHLNIEKENWQEMLTSGEQIANFISGKHFLMPSQYRPGAWVPYQMPNANMQKRAVNITQFYATTCLSKWLSSNPNVKVDPAISTDEAEQAAAGATIVVDRYEREFYGGDKGIQEGMQGMCWGSYIWRIFPDTGKQIATAVREVFENREMELGEGSGQCGECEFSGVAKDFPKVLNGSQAMDVCPKCDSEAHVVPPARGMAPTVVDTQQVPIFDLSAELVPFTNVRWDLQHTFPESPWAIIRKRTNLGVIKAVYGNVRIPSIGTGSDVGLDIAEKLAYSGTPNAGYSGTSGKCPTLYKEPVTIEEHWMSPGDYADIVLDADTETVCGKTIPKGPLVKTFPNGILVQGLNEMSVIFGIFDERHKDYTTQGVWHSKAMSGAGRGLADLVEVNKILNTDNAQIRNYLCSVGTPAMGIIEGALGDENRHQYVGTPGANVPINMSNMPEDTKPQNVVFPLFQPQSVPGQMFDLTYNKNNELAQLLSHNTQFTSGMPGVNNKTATGARITVQNSNSLYTPPLTIKKEVRKRNAEITVDQYCKHVPIERYFPLKGKYGRMQGVSLAGAKLKKDLLQFSVLEGSEQPKNDEIDRENYTAFIQSFPNGLEGYAVAKADAPELVQGMERSFGIRAEAEKYNVVETVCLAMVKQMTQFAQMTDDPKGILDAIQPPVSPLEDNVKEKVKWLRAYLDQDDGREAPPHLRAAIGELITLYFTNDGAIETALAGAQGMAMAAAQAPTALGAAALQQEMAQPPPPPPPEPPPQLSPDAQLKAEAEIAKAELQAKEAAKDRKLESKEAKAQREHEASMAEKEQANKIALAKLKPKPKPAGAKKT